MQVVKTRFAPSPTGNCHLGSARTAVFAYALAMKNGGEFHLRVEDTDPVRSTKESLLDILSGLRWLGIDWGTNGPTIQEVVNNELKEQHFQSQRAKIYNEHVDKLLKEDKAYENDGAVFFRMPMKDCVLNDMVLGEIVFPASEQKDFLIRRKDGTCIFHIANVVDDALAGMTHLIKGNDHTSNYPKHAALFEAFGYKIPNYAHLPLLLDDKGAKLSKRRTDQFVLIRDFESAGYLAETVINMLGLMGWSNPAKTEDFGLDFICKHFDLKDCLKANARYDQKKMQALNSQKIAKMSFEQFKEVLMAYGNRYFPHKSERFSKTNTVDNFAKLYLGRVKTLKDPWESCDFMLSEPEYKPEDIKQVFKTGNQNIFDETVNALSMLNEWDSVSINQILTQIGQKHGVKQNIVSQTMRLAITGTLVSPPIDALLLAVTKPIAIKRMKALLEMACVGV